MKSPLAYDTAVVKEFGIKPSDELEPLWKLAFARTQLEEVQKFLWRERIELLLSEGQANSDIEALAAQGKTKIAEHRTNIKGVVLSLGILEKLVEELAASTSNETSSSTS